MNIPISTHDDIQQTISISFDVYGSLYLHDDSEKSYAHQLNVNGNNTPYFESGTYDIYEPYTDKPGTFTILDKNNSLKTKIKKKLERDIENEEEYNSDDDYDLDGDGANDIDYYPEDGDHLNDDQDANNSDSDSDSGNYLDEDNIKNYGHNNIKFKFWNNTHNNPIPIYYRNFGDIMALYDVYVYDNNNLIFKSNSSDNSSVYRFKIHTNGDIYFRPIGYSEKKYKLKFTDSNELVLIEQL